MKITKSLLSLIILFGVGLTVQAQSKSFSQAFGAYVISWTENDPYIAIKNSGSTQGYMKWTPGGGAQSFLSEGNISQVNVANVNAGKNIQMKGAMPWTDYTIDINIPDLSKGDISVALSLSLKADIDAASPLFANAKPEWELVKYSGSITQPTYYFNGPIPLEDWADYSTMDRWFDRADLNQLVYFGDGQILKSTVLLYEDFTSMDKWFELSGNDLVTKFEFWEKHIDDIVRQPAGSLNSPKGDKYEFGLTLHAPKNKIVSGSEFVLSSVKLTLRADMFTLNEASKYSKRFVDSYSSIYTMLEKPQYKFYDWVDLSAKLVNEMETRKMKNYFTTQHFNMYTMLRYFQQFSPEKMELYSLLAHKETASSLRPNFKNKDGVNPGFAWMDDKPMGAAKVDFWQGYFWPIIQCGEYAILYNDKKLKRDIISTIPLTMATAIPMDYTFSVFVDMNEAKPVKNEYNYDFGAAGGILYTFIIYHDLLAEDQLIPPAEKTVLMQQCMDAAKASADKLISFGFNSGFELNVTAASAWALYRLFKMTGDTKYLDGINTQLAVILKNSWLFNPQYRHFKNRDIFLQSSARANISYANAAEEIMLIRYLENLLREGKDDLDTQTTIMISELVRWKCMTIADGIPALHQDKSVIHEGQGVEWGAIDPNSYVSLEPYGYNGFRSEDGLGFLNHCYYGLAIVPQAALTQFQKLSNDVIVYTEGVAKVSENAGKIYLESVAAGGNWVGFVILPSIMTGKTVLVNGVLATPDTENPLMRKFEVKPNTKHEIIITG